MVKVEVESVFACSAETYLEFVMDPQRYSEVDDKIGDIGWVHREGDVCDFLFRPSLPGMSLPEPKAVSRMSLTPGERVDVRLAPVARNMVNRWVSKFSARFSCVPVDGGIRVTRMISFDFNPVVRWFFEPRVRQSLQASVEREHVLARPLLEGERT
nr:SRPBCC family protein [Kibdelosporangium sp. MJ126-NF4]